MFGLGFMDNSTNCFQNIVCGFQFDSKIIPFGTMAFIENMTVFIITLFLYYAKPDTVEGYRNFFVIMMISSIVGVSLMFCFKYKPVPG